MDKQTLEKLLNRPADSHKYDFGHVLVAGGRPGMVGAPFLAAQAAMRVGAGLVTIVSSAPVIDKLEKRVVEIMTLSLEDVTPKARTPLIDYLNERKVSVCVIGPGMRPEAKPVLVTLLESTELPLVIDGGALAILKDNLQLLDKDREGIILTPHMGEFQRFFEDKLPGNADTLKGFSQDFSDKYNLTLVLKGNPTYVFSPRKGVYVNTTGGPGLATAGSGDVLSGVIGGLLAQDLSPYKAATAGVYLHGLAGDIATAQKTEPGMIASDVIQALPEAFKRALDLSEQAKV